MLKKAFFLMLSCLLLSLSAAYAGRLNQTYFGVPAFDGRITGFDRNGNAIADITNRNFLDAGYLLGDLVSIYFDNGFYLESVPFLDGEYVQAGESYLLASPSGRNITVSIRGERLSDIADLRTGDGFFLRMKEPKGAFDIQFLRVIAPSNNRLDYASDEVFANFREIKAGHMAPARLYRSASPIDNTYGRALYGDNLSRRAGVKSVLNLSDTLEGVRLRIGSRSFRSNYYKSLFSAGCVIGLNMTSEFNTEKFASDITLGIACIIRHRMEPPILIHSTEGRSKTGYVCALLETLMGATYEEIVSDYMRSYSNYYSAASVSRMSYDLVVDNHINEMLFSICKVRTVEELRRVDMSRAAREYLEEHGMTGREIDELMSLLSSQA